MEARHTGRARTARCAARRKRFLETMTDRERTGPTEAEFEARRKELLEECKIPPEVHEEAEARLKTFLEPFLQTFVRQEQCEHAKSYVSGLLSNLRHKTSETIAYLHGQERLGLQRFLGWADWDDAELRLELARQIGRELGEPDGVLVFDPSGFAKSGRESVGVARQWCGRLGKVENCQVGIYLGYVSGQEHALVDMRLYMPQEWTRDKARCKKAGVPTARRRHRTRHQLCLEMLQEKGSFLPHSWIAGDDELGRVSWFRARLHRLDERYLLAVPSNTLIRDLEVEPPAYGGRGRRPKRPWQRVDKWTSVQVDDNWTEVDVRDGSKGPLLVELLKRRVVARTPRRQEGHEEVLVIIRYRDREHLEVLKVDYYLSDAAADTPLAEFARVAKAEHRIEECLQRGKSEAGLADYQVRNWTGWHHHQTLSLLASWFLITETRRGKKMDPGDHRPTNPTRHLQDASGGLPTCYTASYKERGREMAATQRDCSPLPLEAA
jgi:SRSO17 transposase